MIRVESVLRQCTHRHSRLSNRARTERHDVNQNLRLAVIVAIGAVIGSIINGLLAAAQAPAWMTRVMPMGLEPPLSMDLAVIRLTFGFSLSISFATVIGMLIALIAFYRLK